MDYYHRFKSMADALSDLGEQVSDHTLILNILCSLDEKFAAVGRDIQRSRPLPSFLEARDDLLLEELSMVSPSSTPSTALLTGVNTGSSSYPCAPPHQPAGHFSSGDSKGGGPSAAAPASRSGTRAGMAVSSDRATTAVAARLLPPAPGPCPRRHSGDGWPLAFLLEPLDRYNLGVP